jgi:predicted enzyme related to lactoylglutathione lyase
MTEATWYSQGAFCWAELATTDFDGAKAFYGEAFGLGIEETTIPGGVYAQLLKNDKYVAGLTEQQEDERERGIPPHWNTYIAVDDAELVAKEAEQLGATIVAPAFDVLESGRMAVVLDPTGGAIGFWQAKEHIGAALYGEEGTITWWELMTPDPKRAAEFYSKLFGYGTEDFPVPNGTYTVLTHKGEQAAGIMQSPQAEMPAAWTPYFNVANADATLERATALGAGAMMPVTEMPGVGRFSWITDPQGAVIAFIQPAPRDQQ